MKRFGAASALCLAALLAASGTALAQERAVPREKSLDEKPLDPKAADLAAKEKTKENIAKAKVKQPRKGVFRFEGDVIEGKIQKPEAFYLLQRSSLTFEGLQLKTDLVPKIIRSLKKAPF